MKPGAVPWRARRGSGGRVAEWATDGIPDSLKRLNDSKQLSESVREELYEAIQANDTIVSAVAVVEAPVIDEINILQATHRAMSKLSPA